MDDGFFGELNLVFSEYIRQCHSSSTVLSKRKTDAQYDSLFFEFVFVTEIMV